MSHLPIGKLLVGLVRHPAETWSDLAADSGHPADYLWPGPVLLAAVGSGSFLVGHGMIGQNGVTLPLGRSLGFAIVYYTLVVACGLGQAFLLGRLGAALGAMLSFGDSLRLVAFSLVPFFLSGVAFVVPVSPWESLVVVSGILGLGGSAWLLYQGLRALGRSDSRALGLLVAVGTGALLSVWILGLFVLKKVIL